MSKVILRLIVVIALVIASVAITMVILNKPNYNTTVYKTWQSVAEDSRYNLNEKINTTISCSSVSYNGRTLNEIEPKIANVANLGQSIEDYISYLLKFTKYSEDVKEKDAKKLKKSLSKYYDLMLDEDSTGYWVTYYYDYVQGENFDELNFDVYNQIVQTIESKWLIQAKEGTSIIVMLEDYVANYCFEGIMPTDLKTTLLNFSAQFASVYVNSESYASFEVNHLNEYKNLLVNIDNKLSQSDLSYTDSDITLAKNYGELTEQELIDFISSTDKVQYIHEISNQGSVMQAKVDTLNALLTYLGV